MVPQQRISQTFRESQKPRRESCSDNSKVIHDTSASSQDQQQRNVAKTASSTLPPIPNYDEICSSIDLSDSLSLPHLRAIILVVLVASAAVVASFSQTFIHILNTVGIFGLILLLVWTYDSSVERRQRIFMKTVLDSYANTSLLEELVLERTLEITNANKSLKDVNRKLAATSAAQLQTFACMSHEIRTPLNCIISLSHLLQEGTLTAKQDESLKLMTSSSDLLLAVVNDALDYSKLASGEMEVETRQESLQVILDSIIGAMEAKAKERKITLVTNFDPSVSPLMITDGVKLQQCLYNILGNAIKFSSPNSPVELHLTMAQPTRASGKKHVDFYSPTDENGEQYSANFGNNQQVLRFSITNNGEGIAREDMEKIFQPFRQSSTGKGTKDSTGLGLAITAKLIHALGARISVESEKGAYTTFSAEFPSDVSVPFDTEELSDKLDESTVALIFQDEDVIKRMDSVWQAYGLESVSLGTLESLKLQLRHGTISGKHLIILVDEQIYDQAAFKDIVRFTKRRGSTRHKITLMTIGTNHVLSFEKSHIRSLTRMLPTVLLEHLSMQVPALQPNSILGFKRCTSCDVHTNTNSYMNYRVLVADDNIINQKVMDRMLNRIGIENIDIANDGQEAVDLEAANSYDVILMDVEMPRVDGIEACKIIKKRHNKKFSKALTPKVVFVSGHTKGDFGITCHKAGATGFVSKPCKLKDLKECFESIHEAMLSSDMLSRSLSGESAGRSQRRLEMAPDGPGDPGFRRTVSGQDVF